MEDLGSKDELIALAGSAELLLRNLDGGVQIGYDKALKKTGHPINNSQMVFSTKIILYTNAVHVPYENVMAAFGSANLLVEIVNESEMYRTLFISYGGTDEGAASEINSYLKVKGVKTWFFPDDALPGQKLHRVMHDEIDKHERALLICSEKALSRHGVLNEIERVLEREAREGGSEVLIPITLDDFVYGDWAPARPDVAAQVRTRVITKVDLADEKLRDRQLDKLVAALKKAP
jgi:hypothetical protein